MIGSGLPKSPVCRQRKSTAIRHHVQSVTPGSPFDWRILLNGRLDELVYERGTIGTSMPFEELKTRSNITERAKAIGKDADFSARIRDGLPRRSGAALPAESESAESPRS